LTPVEPTEEKEEEQMNHYTKEYRKRREKVRAPKPHSR
jgi:hypothetical protein